MPALTPGLRAELADTLLTLGPDEPTLCAGWSTADLAAHLVARDRRPDAAPGIVLPPLAGWTAKVMKSLQSQGYDALADDIRTPPAWSPLRIERLDDVANTVEFAVHLEDARRGGGDLTPRADDPALDDALWRSLSRQRRLLLHRAPVSVRLETPEGQSSGSDTAKVTVVGKPLELLLFCLGRQQAAHVDLHGSGDDTEALGRAKLGF